MYLQSQHWLPERESLGLHGQLVYSNWWVSGQWDALSQQQGWHHLKNKNGSGPLIGTSAHTDKSSHRSLRWPWYWWRGIPLRMRAWVAPADKPLCPAVQCRGWGNLACVGKDEEVEMSQTEQIVFCPTMREELMPKLRSGVRWLKGRMREAVLCYYSPS